MTDPIAVVADVIDAHGPVLGARGRDELARAVLDAIPDGLAKVGGGWVEPVYESIGWWYHNVNSGKVHQHPERPGRNWSEPMHRLCVPVYTKRSPDA